MLTKEQAIASYNKRHLTGGEVAKAASPVSSGITKEEAIRKYDAKQAERYKLKVINEAFERERSAPTYETYIPEKYKEVAESPEFKEYAAKWKPKSKFQEWLQGTSGEQYAYMTDEERALADYVISKGGGGVKASGEFYSEMDEELKRRAFADQLYRSENADGFWDKAGVSLESLYHTAASGLTEAPTQLMRYVAGKELDDNPYHTMTSQIQRAGVSEDMSGFGKFLYNTGMSMADSVISIGIGTLLGGGAGSAVSGAVSLAMMGSEAMSSTVVGAKERGLDDGKALFLGVLSGTIEAVTEKAGLDALFDTKLFKQSVVNYLWKNVGSNAAEEATAEALNKIADIAVAGADSEFMLSVEEYVNSGMSQSEAIGKAVLDSFGDVALSGASGALMGLGFGGVGSAVSSIRQGSADVRSGREILDLEHTENLLYEAAKASGVENIGKTLEKAQSAEFGSRKQAKYTGKLAREVADLAAERESEYLTEDEVRHLEGDEGVMRYYADMTEFEQKVENLGAMRKMAQRDALKEILLTEDIKASKAQTDPEKKYTGETLKAYKAGLEQFKGSADEYRLWWTTAYSLGLEARGKSLTDMVNTLSVRDRRGVLSMPSGAVAAAFRAGVDYNRAVDAEQGIVNLAKQKAAEKKASAERESAASNSDGKAEKRSESSSRHADITSEGVKRRKLTPTQKQGVKKVELLARVLDGFAFRVETVEENSDLRDTNAYINYDTKGGVPVIHINIEAGREGRDIGNYALEAAFTHECGHGIKKYAPRQFEELKRFIKKNFYTEGSWDAAVRTRQSQYEGRLKSEFSWEKAEEEVVCNSLGKLLSNQRVMNKLAAEHRNIFARVWKAVTDFFEKLVSQIRRVGEYSSRTPEQRIVEQGAAKLQRALENKFVTALRDANTAAKAVSDVKAAEKAKADVVTTDGSNSAKTGENPAVTNTNGDNMKVSHFLSDNAEKYSYDSLVKKGKIKVVDLPLDIPTRADGIMDRGAVILAGRINARNHNNINNTQKETYVFVPDISLNVRINRDGLEHGLSHRADDSALATMAIGDLLSNSIAVNELDGRKTNKKETEMSFVLVAIGQNKKGPYIVRIVVDKNTNAISEISSYGLYGLRAKKEGAFFLPEDNEGVEAEASVPYLDSTISIADLLDNVKGNNLVNEIFSEDVAKKLGVNRSKGTLSKDLRYSLADKLDREALAEAFYGLASTDEEREAMRQYRSEIEDIDDKLSERARLLRRYDEIGDKRAFAGERERLREQIDRITDDVTRKDRKLLEISAAKPFRDIMERYEKNIGNRRNTAGTVTMSRGEYEKNRAKFTHSRFYSKADAREALKNIPETKTIREKTRAQLVEELWIGLNAADGELERTEFIVMMKNKICDAILDEAVADNPEYERQREILEKIKPYISHLTFEKGVYNAITYKLGKEKARSYFGRWSNKHKGESGIDSDRFVEEIIRYVPEFMRLRTMDTSDALIELDAIYTEAIEEERYISAIDDTSSREITELNSKIVDELLSAYRELGLESPYVKELKEGRKAKRQLDNARKHAEKMEEIYEARKESFKEKYNGMVDYFKATLALDRVARSIRNMKLGTFENATEVRGDRVSGLLRELARFEYRQTFSPNEIRAKVSELRDWYTTSNEMLEYKDEKNPGYYLPGIRELLDELVVDENGNKKRGTLTATEAWNLYDVLTYFKHFVENYNKVFYQGKWVDIVPLAESFMDDLRESRDSDGGRLDSIVDSRLFKWYFDNFSDPLAVVRRYDRYTENGFFTRILRMLQEAKVRCEVAFSDSMADYYGFIKRNPNYARDLQTQSVEIYGHKVPKAQAIALYMTLKQKDAHAGFLYSGFTYVNFKGGRIKAKSVFDKVEIEEKIKARTQELVASRVKKVKKAEAAAKARDEILEEIASREREKIEKNLTKLDREIIAIEEEGFNTTFRNMKYRTDMRRRGYSNVGKGYYCPIKRNDKALLAETEAYQDELESVSNISANKNRVAGAEQGLYLVNFMTMYERHGRAICTYAEMRDFVDFYNRIYNTDISGNKNNPVTVLQSANEVWGRKETLDGRIVEFGNHDYFNKLIADAQGLARNSDKILDKAIGQLRKGTVVAGLALNGKVLLSQLSSYGAALHILSPGALMKGVMRVIGNTRGGLNLLSREGWRRLRELGETVDKYCPFARIRKEDNHAYLAQGVVEKKDGTVVRKNKAGELLERGQEIGMSPIGAMDRAVVCALFEACKIDAAKEGTAIGSDENLVRAGELLKKVILDTQQNSISTERSAAMRSSSEIVKGFTMFSSDAMKTQGRFLDAVGELVYAKKRLVRTSDLAKRAKLEAQIKEAGKKVTKSTAVLVGNSVYMAAVALLFRYLRGKLEDEEEIVGELLSDFGSNLIGGLPLIRDFVDLLSSGYDVSHFAYDTVNTFGTALTGLGRTVEGLLDGKADAGDVVSSLRKLTFAYSQVVGVPIRNVWNAIYGFFKRHFPEVAEKIDSFLK